MKKIILASIIALGLSTTISADTNCQVTRSVPQYEKKTVRIPTTSTYQVRVDTRVQCGFNIVDVPNSDDMKAVPKYCNGSYLETKSRTHYTYKEQKVVTTYKNYFTFDGVEYFKRTKTPMKIIIVNH